MDLTTSKGTPLNKYSSVAPMHMPWPFRGSMPSSEATKLICLRNLVLMRGRIPLGCFQENKGWSSGGSLIRKWLARAEKGSAGPSCVDQKTSSPVIEVLVCGSLKTVTLLPCQSWSHRMSDRLTWCEGLKAFKEGRVNSLNLAAAKKVVVRQAKTAASRGLERLNLDRRETIMGMVKGEHFGLFEDGGAKMTALFKAVFILAVFILQGAPWRTCQARIAYK